MKISLFVGVTRKFCHGAEGQVRVAVRFRRTKSLIAAVIAVVAFASAAPAHAQPQKGNPPVYLALGDSYPYGSECLANPCNTADGAVLCRKQ